MLENFYPLHNFVKASFVFGYEAMNVNFIINFSFAGMKGKYIVSIKMPLNALPQNHEYFQI